VAWVNGKAQRGYIASTGAHAAPAFEASVAHYNIYSWALINADGALPDHSQDIAYAAAQNKTAYKFFKTFGGYAASPTHGSALIRRIKRRCGGLLICGTRVC
jgi:hypothetical protein